MTRRPETWIPLIVFCVLIVHGGLLGPTDDEAYYWVLSQKPALGYAYHPPGVAWSIAFFNQLLGWAFTWPTTFILRLPAAVYSAGIVALGMRWLRDVGASKRQRMLGALVLLAFPGFFAVSWMMVPDLPLFFGWTLAFWATWRICDSASRTRDLVWLGLGVALALLSKFSGILVAGSAGLAILFWAPSRRERYLGVSAILIGVTVAVIPTLIWNSQNDWAAILYQFRERHGESVFSMKRYLRFWGAQLICAGPVLLAFAFTAPWRVRSRDAAAARISRYILVWALPAALVFCLQPAWSDFKPHWAFAVWLPIALELSWYFGQAQYSKRSRVQIGYGALLILVVYVACHYPLVAGFTSDPKMDVTNDLYGWRRLRDLKRTGQLENLPVLASRYQTASQAAFALGNMAVVTLIPRTVGQMKEWPVTSATSSQGPEWPNLLSPVYFVTDNRYDAGPAFPNADCKVMQRLEDHRLGHLAKWVEVWRCQPR